MKEVKKNAANEPDKGICDLPFRQARCWQQAPPTEGSPCLAHSHFNVAATWRPAPKAY